MILSHYPVPVFGWFLTGWAAVPAYADGIAFLAYAVRGIYRLQAGAFWATVAVVTLFSASNVVTIKTRGLMAFYEAMQYPQEKIDYLRSHMYFSDNAFVLMSLLWAALFIGYFLRIRRFFRRPPQDAGTPL